MRIKEYVFATVVRVKYIKQTIIRNNRKVGVNYPPLHSNYRSRTRGYLGKEAYKRPTA